MMAEVRVRAEPICRAGPGLAASRAFVHPRGMNRFFRLLIILLLSARLDRESFGAFSQHDGARLMSLFSDDLEFYHDAGGVSNHGQNADSFKKVCASSPDIRRALEPRLVDLIRS
jgi:hypothetical protein